AIKLLEAPDGSRLAQQVLAQNSGLFEIELEFQLQVSKSDSGASLMIPVQNGLINKLDLTIANLDVDISSAQAVSIQRDNKGSNTVATLILAPVKDALITWRPRTRDVKHERPVFYAELSQLYAPAAGVVEGVHYVSIRPAQGELNDLFFNVPAGMTITDVTETSKAASIWRFDPDTR